MEVFLIRTRVPGGYVPCTKRVSKHFSNWCLELRWDSRKIRMALAISLSLCSICRSCRASNSASVSPCLNPSTRKVDSHRLNGSMGSVPCNRKYAEYPVDLQTVMLSANRAARILSGHRCILPWQAFTKASLMAKCPCSTTPFAWELYGEM